jgi:hypothetical protein
MENQAYYGADYKQDEKADEIHPNHFALPSFLVDRMIESRTFKMAP